MRDMRWPKPAGLLPIALGLGTNAYFLGLTDPMFAWTALPYGVCAIALTVMRSAIPATVAASVVAGMDILNAYSVFINPTSSTAALGLLWIPFWNLVAFVPIVLIVGWAMTRKDPARKLTPQSRADGP